MAPEPHRYDKEDVALIVAAVILVSVSIWGLFGDQQARLIGALASCVSAALGLRFATKAYKWRNGA